MQKVIDWLAIHRAANFVLFVGYFLVVVLPHKAFGSFLNDVVFQGITRDQYNLYVIIGFTVMLAIFGRDFLVKSLKSALRWKLIGYMLATIVFTVVIINTLFVINIEVIHFPQYAVLAIILFPLIRHYHSTLIWATLFGVVDEGYQYFYLAPNDIGYFDFNDVLTNLVGAAFGLLVLWSLGIRSIHRVFVKSSAFYALVAFAAIVVAAIATGLLSIYADPDSHFHLLISDPRNFWSSINHNVVYHVVRPLEGTLLTIGFWMFYVGLGRKTTGTQS